VSLLLRCCATAAYDSARSLLKHLAEQYSEL
jgi:hypothetical protein